MCPSACAKQKKITQTHLLRFTRLPRDPRLGLIPSLVQSQEARLSTTLDELVGLRDELGSEHPARELRVRGDGTCLRVP